MLKLAEIEKIQFHNLNTVKLGYNEQLGTGRIVRYNRGSLQLGSYFCLNFRQILIESEMFALMVVNYLIWIQLDLIKI